MAHQGGLRANLLENRTEIHLVYLCYLFVNFEVDESTTLAGVKTSRKWFKEEVELVSDN